MTLVHVKGLAPLQQLLNELPAKMEANVMRSALRVGAKIVLEEAKQNVAIEEGVLRDGLKISTGVKRGKVYAKVKATGKHAFLAPWIEFGTTPHTINSKKKAELVERPNRRATKGTAKRWVARQFEKGGQINIASKAFGPSMPRWVTILNHPGSKPKPFMRPALDSKAGQALVAIGQHIKERLAKKHGLDTADINIEESDDEN